MLISIISFSQRISGSVRDEKGQPMANASIMVKGTTRGTNSNNEGYYFIDISKPGLIELVCQHVGYTRSTKLVDLTKGDQDVDFQLNPLDFMLEEVIVRSGENPANQIMRNAIQKRSFYNQQIEQFSCEVYTKGVMRVRSYPKKFMGQPLFDNDADTSKDKIIFLSETIASYHFMEPNKRKIIVSSSRVSGNSDGYGLAAPQFYSLYENNVRIGSNLNPRGFISPISENAFNYYRYKYEGAFFEDGKQINRIRIIPKRKYEPLFSGYMNIIENDWRIHSLRLELTKESQMEFIDTLVLEQIYVPLHDDVWVMQSQVIYPAVKMFGIDAHGSFVNVYTSFEDNPDFPRDFFDNTILKYTDSSNRKTPEYWDDSRPVKLLEEEIRDYRKKDSLERVSKDPVYLDSLDRVSNRISIPAVLLFGESFSRRKNRETLFVRPLTDQVSFNIVEGLVMNVGMTYEKRLDTLVGRRRIRLSPNLRYGFNNKHFNAHAIAEYVFGKKYISSISMGGGKRVYQFNNASPISARSNTLASLIGHKNLLKLYEAWFGRIDFTKGIGDGFTWSIFFEYQDRMPLENTTNYTWSKSESTYTPNYPTELISRNFERHQALSGGFAITFQPGARYIELPGQKINIGSRWPVFSLSYTKSVDWLGSDVDYGKWKLGITDIVNMRMIGLLNYRIGLGGFLDRNRLEVPDYHHFNGNISRIATPYLNSFQVLPIYQFSNTSRLYALAHVEHHMNGFLTNKIPGFKKLNWYLVTGANAFTYSDINYLELMVGVENIFKSLRIDYVWAFQNGKRFDSNFRIGIRNLFGSR